MQNNSAGVVSRSLLVYRNKKMAKFNGSFYQTVKANQSKTTSLDQLFEDIKNGVYSEYTEIIALARSKGMEPEAKEVKLELPAFTASGVFKKGRRADLIDQYNRLIVLDFDDVSDVEVLKGEVIKDDHTMAAFISPSGNGLKVVVEVDSELQHHRQAFDQVAEYYESRFKAEVDRSGSDVTRLCFMSSDEDIFVNWEPEVFIVKVAEEKQLEQDVKSHGEMSEKQKQDYQIAMQILDYLRENDLSITTEYNDWFRVGQALASTFDENLGLDLYLKFASQAGEKFDEEATIKQWERALKTGNGDIKFATLVYLAQQLGFEYSESENEFWYRRASGALAIDNYRFSKFLSLFEYGKTFYEGDYILVKSDGNILQKVLPAEIKDFLMPFFDGREFNGTQGDEILNVLMSTNKHFSRGSWEWLNTLQLNMLKDEADRSYLFYRNGYLEVTADDTVLHSYSELDSHIWKDDIIDRDYRKVERVTDHDFWRFIELITGEDERTNALMSAIGYLLHRYKDPSNTKAVILVDEKENLFGESNGGTGKSLLGEAIGRVRNAVKQDGKNFKFNRFAFQLVSMNTDVLIFDDVVKDFAFNNLFTSITNDMTVEKKGETSFNIPSSESPKILISSNFEVTGDGGGSDKRRKIIIELTDHFSSVHQPIDEFECRFFDDWDENYWAIFDNIMVFCLQQYFKNGLIEYELINVARRILNKKTCPEFVEFVAEFEVGKKYELHQELENFRKKHDRFYKMGQHAFNKWIRLWMDAEGLTTEEQLTTSRDFSSVNGKTYMTFIKKPEKV